MVVSLAKRREKPVVILIGYPQCGGDLAVRLFRRNGFAAMGGASGQVAENILYSLHRGSVPLRPWGSVTLFADLECITRLSKPLLQAHKEFRFLHRCFPDAVFVLNHRDPDRWLAARAAQFPGGRADALARALGVEARDLPAHWRAEWDRHLQAARRYFAGHERFCEIDIYDEGLDRLRERMQPWYDLPETPRDRGEAGLDGDAENLAALKALQLPKPAQGNAGRRDAEFEQAVVQHCIGQAGCETGQDSLELTSRVYGRWDGHDRVYGGNGSPLQMTLASVGGKEAFLADAGQFKIERVQGVINEVLGLGRRLPLEIDMEDARKYGMAGVANPTTPILTYCRRPGARNVILWPLPDYHSLGNPLFAQPEPFDPVDFNHKADAVGWRGKLAGRAGFQDTDGRDAGRSAKQILDELLTGPPPAREEQIEAELLGIVRYRVLRRLADRDDFDMWLTLHETHAGLHEHRLLQGLCGELRTPEWFFGYRYIPVLSGYDTGSNFFLAANSNSVVLKEDDGWSLFYSDAFRPWQHFVPLAQGADDIEEKLEWARSNPARCRDMVRASQDVCRRFADPDMRARILNAVLDGYAAL